MFRFAAHIVILGIISSNLALADNGDKLCQSGLREDNTNYIYCARQNLTTIPSFLNQANTSSTMLSGGSNIFYDELVLSDNLIDAIELNSFASMLKVRKLYLDLNPVRYIHELAFQHVRNYLEELYFDFKVTGEDKAAADDSLIFENSIFQKCFNLHLLSIKGYQLDKLKPLQFLRMSKLDTLILSNNKITHLHENAFKGLDKALTHLNLDSNYLEWIPTAAIQGLRNLMRLSLSQNRIKSVHANAFLNLKRISYLDLSYNYLSKLDSHGFNGAIQTSLETILLQNNELKWSHLIHLLFNLRSLQELNLDFNKLSGNSIQLEHRLRAPGLLDKADPAVQLKLQILSMQGNRLDEKSLNALRASFDYDLLNYADSNSELSSFEFIDSYQDSRQILSKWKQRFSFGNLLQLNLARNKIKNLPYNFFQQANMSLLNTLVLDKNPLESTRITQKYFNGLEKSLTSLSLNGVGFNLWSPSSIEALLSLERLQTLKLNGNNQRVENLNVNTLKLDNLKAKSNQKPQLPNLTSLELQNNNLKQLPTFVCQLNALNDLDLSSNQLAELNLNCFKSAMSPKLRLKKLNLNNNPLNCDCDLLELKNWLMQTYDKDLLDLIMWQCARPFQLAGRYLVNVQQDELTCPSSGLFTEAFKPTKTLPFIQILSSVSINKTIKAKLVTSTTTTTTTTTTATASIRSGLTSTQFLNRFKTEKILTAKNVDLSYYSLVIGISLGISAICLIILLIFYINCIRRMDSPSNGLKNTNPIQYSNPTNNKYEAKFKFCSPTSSSSSSSSTNSTTTTVMSSRKNNDDSLSHDSCLSLPGEHSFKTNKKHILFNNNFGQQANQNNVCRCNCNDLNMLQLNESQKAMAFIQKKQNVFSINEPFMQMLSDGKSTDTHIYHEINSPSKNCCNNKTNENHFFDHHYTETQYVFPKNDSLTFILNNINNGRSTNNTNFNKANMQRLLNYNNKNINESGLSSSNQYLINDLGSGLIV